MEQNSHWSSKSILSWVMGRIVEWLFEEVSKASDEEPLGVVGDNHLEGRIDLLFPSGGRVLRFGIIDKIIFCGHYDFSFKL